MQRQILASLIATTVLAATGVQAATYTDQARVRDVQPRYETVQVPRQVCSNQWVRDDRRAEAPRQYGGAVIGGVAGALLGNQVGDGGGRAVATALGAVIGAYAGDQVANNGRDDRYARYDRAPRQVQNCQTVYEPQQRINGYNVSYDYRGQRYTTVMAQPPSGRTIPIQVSSGGRYEPDGFYNRQGQWTPDGR